jgi:hypothetical protein
MALRYTWEPEKEDQYGSHCKYACDKIVELIGVGWQFHAFMGSIMRPDGSFHEGEGVESVEVIEVREKTWLCKIIPPERNRRTIYTETLRERSYYRRDVERYGETFEIEKGPVYRVFDVNKWTRGCMYCGSGSFLRDIGGGMFELDRDRQTGCEVELK